jgi:hypothetical protein
LCFPASLQSDIRLTGRLKSGLSSKCRRVLPCRHEHYRTEAIS